MKKREKESKGRIFSIVLRYIILLVIVFSLSLIYKILTPLTTGAVSFFLGFFYQVYSAQDIIAISPATFIKLIPACIAGSAYLLLIVLNLLVAMDSKKRIYSLLFSLGILFALNVFRIFILSVFLVNDFQFFDFAHKLFWYGLSTVFVVAIWFMAVRIFSIKEIPAYSDLRYLLDIIRKKA